MSEGESEDHSQQARQQQLLRLRELCIPEVVTLLQKVLQETKQYDELKQLVELIQSEDYQLYKVGGLPSLGWGRVLKYIS